MDVKLSHRANSIKPSPTLSVSARAAEMKAAGQDIISLAAGEPDFDTPEHVKAAAVKALKDGFTKYTAVDGTPALKKAVITKFKRENGLDYEPQQVLVSCGCKHSIYNLTQAMLNPGDEVIIPAPYWVSYPDMVRLAGAEPVIIKTGIDKGFKITKEQLRGAITAKTRLLILNSPSNPTGVTYSADEYKELGDVLREHPDMVIATDDIYEHILFTGEPFVNIVNACPELHERTVVLNGVSKAYAMTGWRIGYAAGPKNLIQAMNKIQSQSTSNPTSFAQVAAQAALEGDQSQVKEWCGIFKQRHDYIFERLNRLPGVECLPADGTFYIFPNMQGLMDRLGLNSDIDLAEQFLEKAQVAMVPGSAFGAPGCMRLSFACSMESIEQALDRMERAFGQV